MGKKFKKFLLNKSSVLLGVVITLVSLALFLTMLFLLELRENDHTTEALLIILKEIFLIVFTVFASTLITALFIETRSKNNEYISTIANEVVSDPNVVNVLNDEPKALLRKRLADDSLVKQDMFDSFVSSVKNEDHYFESCDIDITCKITNNRIEKTIVRNMSICSFESKTTLKDFKLLGVAGKEDYSVQQNFKNKINIISINIGGKKLKETDYKILCEKVEDDSSGLKRNNYFYKCKCVIPELVISSNKPVKIRLEYISYVGLDDLVYVSRATAPCKKYKISFALENDTKKKYAISASAFGFMDNNMSNNHNNSNESYNVDFDHWVYKHDGVSIYIIKK